MEIKTVAILGAGAVGSYFLWGLKEKLGENVFVVAEGERAERLKKDGINVNDEHLDLTVKTPEEAKNPDLLMVCVKYNALESSLDMIERVVGENTIVMSMLNGVDSEEIIASRIGEERILYSFMFIGSQRVGNTIRFSNMETTGPSIGEKYTTEKTDRVLAVEELFNGTPCHCHYRENILHSIWGKFAMNIRRNVFQAMVGAGIGMYRNSEAARDMAEAMRQEVVAVAAAKGVDIRELTKMELDEEKLPNLAAKYSTLQDIEAKRRTEVDMLCGAVIRLGKQYGIPTPYNQAAYWTIRALEEKNEGKFDF